MLPEESGLWERPPEGGEEGGSGGKEAQAQCRWSHPQPPSHTTTWPHTQETAFSPFPCLLFPFL